MKRKVKDFELKNLILIKECQNETKMKNLNYEKLKQEDYLTKLDVWQAKEVFRYRTRMANYSGNFRGQGLIESCPLCGEHEDHQSMSLKCPTILKEIKIEENYENIFKPNITPALATMLMKITKMRNKKT